MDDIFDKAEHENLRAACFEMRMDPGLLKFEWNIEGDFRHDKSFFGSGEISMIYKPTGKSKQYAILPNASQHMQEIETDIRSGYYLV